MPIESQYYIETQTPEGEKQGVLDVLSPDKDLINWFHINEHEKGIKIVFHGPSSAVHMERAQEVADITLLRDVDGDVISYPETGEEFCMPKTKEVYGEEMQAIIDSYLERLPQGKRKRFSSLLNELENETMYGEFSVGGLQGIADGETYDPAKVISAFALKLAQEKKNRLHEGKISMVLHTSALYFLSQGDFRKIPEKMKVLDEMCEVLDMNVSYENITFSNPVFSEALPWMEHPDEFLDLFPTGMTTSGLCVDIEHLERIGWSDEEINDFINRARTSKRTNEVVLHTDQDSSVLDKESLMTAYTSGIPVAYEPK